MSGLIGCAVLLSAVLPLSAQSGIAPEIPPETLLLIRIREHMTGYLMRQPDYTCLETIERSQRMARSRRFRTLDTLRVEVAVVDDQEMFSWPGAAEFEETDLSALVPTGSVGTGSFAIHSRAVFVSNSPVFTYQGEEELDGRRLVRYDYRVSRRDSGYTMCLGEDEAIVAYHGSFWADPATLDAYRLLVVADDIPPHMKTESVTTTIDYERADIGGREFLLPRRAVSRILDIESNERRNETVFSGCRQYTGESVLSFAAPPAEVEPAPAPPEMIELPENLRMELALLTPIDDAVSVVGDLIEAEVASAVKRKGEVLIPHGARVTGRLVHLRRIGGQQQYFQVAIRLEALVFNSKRAELHAALDRFTSPFPRLSQVSLRPDFPRVDPRTVPWFEEPAGVSVFYVRGDRVRLGRGTRMVWRTTPPPPSRPPL